MASISDFTWDLDTPAPEPPKPPRIRRARRDDPRIPATRRCPECATVKPSSEFGLKQSSRDGLFTYCNTCRRELDRLRLQDRTPDEILNQQEAHIKRTYGITLRDYVVLLEQQGGGCGICGGPPNHKKGYHIDHDHTTGKVRGILCHGCNAALGGAKDNPATLRAAADYLERHGK